MIETLNVMFPDYVLCECGEKVELPELWVDCKYFLPHYKIEVLLSWGDGSISSGWYVGNGIFQHANGENDYDMDEKVTHWMPMPKEPSLL